MGEHPGPRRASACGLRGQAGHPPGTGTAFTGEALQGATAQLPGLEDYMKETFRGMRTVISARKTQCTGTE